MNAKKNTFRYIFLVLVTFCAVALSACTADLTLELKKDGQIAVAFKGSAGPAFTKMIQAATGNDSVVFETEEIAAELEKSGFINVNATSNNADIQVSMVDAAQKTFIVNSGLVQTEKNDLSVILNAKNLYNFYSTADEQIVMILDLLIAPVFNDEQLEESEYLELLGSFYGDSIAQELSQSVLNLTVIGADGAKKEQKIPLATLLCLADQLVIHSSNL